MTSRDVALDAFETLHAARIKGVLVDADGADIAGLQTAGLVKVGARGIVLTPYGLETHAQLLRDEQASINRDLIAATYERFLAVNGPVKAACTRWQQSSGDAESLSGTVESLAAHLARVRPALRRAAAVLRRFSSYQRRLDYALERATAGDATYVTDLTVDSFHTVWFECHEDYLLTLDLVRDHES